MSKASTGLDIAAFDTVAASNKGAEIELKHPVTMEPLGAFVTVLGKDSDIFRQAFRRKVNAKLARDAMAKKRGKDVEPPTVEDSEADGLDLLVACTTGWRGLTDGGEPLEYSPEAARNLYTRAPWIRLQVDEAIGDLANFMKS